MASIQNVSVHATNLVTSIFALILVYSTNGLPNFRQNSGMSAVLMFFQLWFFLMRWLQSAIVTPAEASFACNIIASPMIMICISLSAELHYQYFLQFKILTNTRIIGIAKIVRTATIICGTLLSAIFIRFVVAIYQLDFPAIIYFGPLLGIISMVCLAGDAILSLMTLYVCKCYNNNSGGDSDIIVNVAIKGVRVSLAQCMMTIVTLVLSLLPAYYGEITSDVLIMPAIIMQRNMVAITMSQRINTDSSESRNVSHNITSGGSQLKYDISHN